MAKHLGFGTDLLIGTTSDVVNTIGQIQNIEGPSAERPNVDVTTLDSSGRDFLAAIRDGGTVTITIMAEDADDQGTDLFWGNYSNFLSGLYRHFEIHHPGDTSKQIQFKGEVTAIGYVSFAVDEPLTAAIDIKVTGPIDWPT